MADPNLMEQIPLILLLFIVGIGAAHCIMSTDAGQWLNPPAAQQMGIYIKEALKIGISAQDVRCMVADNPAKILGIYRIQELWKS